MHQHLREISRQTKRTDHPVELLLEMSSGRRIWEVGKMLVIMKTSEEAIRAEENRTEENVADCSYTLPGLNCNVQVWYTVVYEKRDIET